MRQGLRLQVAHSPVGNGTQQNTHTNNKIYRDDTGTQRVVRKMGQEPNNCGHTHTNAGLEIHAASDMLFSRTFKEQCGKKNSFSLILYLHEMMDVH